METISARSTRARNAWRDSAGALSGAPARLEIDVFEGRAFRSGREIALTDGEFAIAAAFAMHAQTVGREEWCDLLWPDRDPESAARLLKVYVHRIRSKFGDDRIVATHGNGYRLGGAVRVDVLSLAALVRRSATDCPDRVQIANVERAFAGFRERRYRRLETLACYAALERRIVATGLELARVLVHDAFARDDGARALDIAEHAATLDPYDEVAIELLIDAQLRLGRRDAASRAFRTFVRTLREELDAAPPAHLAARFAAVNGPA